MKDISDGAKHTIFVGEKLFEQDVPDLGWLSGTRATLRNTGTPLNETGPAARSKLGSLLIPKPGAAGEYMINPEAAVATAMKVPHGLRRTKIGNKPNERIRSQRLAHHKHLLSRCCTSADLAASIWAASCCSRSAMARCAIWPTRSRSTCSSNWVTGGWKVA